MKKMRKPEDCSINYLGFEKPRSKEELRFVVLGLKTAIASANKRIAELEQSLYLFEQEVDSVEGGS